VGEAKLTRQVVNVLEFQPEAVEGFRVDGMIGFEVFRRFVTQIDYRGRTMTLIKPQAFHPHCGTPAVNFVFYDHLPQIQGMFEGLVARFDIDTGSRTELTLTKPFVDGNSLRENHSKGVIAVDGWGVGGPVQSYVTRASELKLGSIVVSDIVASLAIHGKGSFSDTSYEGNVGSVLLKRFDATFDYGHQVLYLAPLVAPVPDVANFDRSGMWINAANGSLKVMDVTPAGAAAMAGLKVGDEIVAVDDARVEPQGLSDLRARLRDSVPGTVVNLTVKRNSGIETIHLTLRDQI
jgi:membrane-associated protease RseP (regulator of RpoE activity)